MSRPARIVDMWGGPGDNGEALIGVAVECRWCQQAERIDGMPLEGFQRWLLGEATRTALPGLTIAATDLLVSGVHSGCLLRGPR